MDTREQWLSSAVYRLRPVLHERAGLTVPTVRVSCGDLGKTTLGMCYSKASVSDGVPEISVSLRHETDPRELLGTVVHELIHAAGIMNHYRNFGRAARSAGLVGGPSTKWPRDPAELPDYVAPMLKRLGPWPAPAVRISKRTRPQGTRMLRVSCTDCPIIWRTTATHLDRGVRCPTERCHGAVRAPWPHGDAQ